MPWVVRLVQAPIPAATAAVATTTTRTMRAQVDIQTIIEAEAAETVIMVITQSERQSFSSKLNSN